MKIAEVEVHILESGYLGTKIIRDRAASPMGRFPRFAETRSSWIWPTAKVATVVRADNGAQGVSITNGGEVVAAIASRLGWLIRGETVDSPQDLWELMMRSITLWDRSGFVGMGLAALDIAIWDLCADEAGKPLIDLLGGARTDSMPVYITTARPMAGSGFTGVKMPARYGPESGEEGMRQNCMDVAAAREVLGTGADVSCDCCVGWDAGYTAQMIERLEPYRMRWIEDPLLPNDIEGFRKLAEAGHKFSVGNFLYSYAEIKQFLEMGVVEALQPDVAWSGGITENLRIAELARKFSVPLIFHNTTEQPWALALSFALPCAEVEHVDRGGQSILAELFAAQAPAPAGALSVADIPASNRLSAAALSAMRRYNGDQ